MKKLITIALILVLVLSVAACGAKTTTETANAEIDTKAIADKIKDEVAMQDGLNLVESDRNAENAFPGILEMVDEYTIYVNATGGYAEEIAVFKLKDGISAEDITAKLDERVEYQKTVFEDYQPREMPKLETSTTLIEGRLAILVIADDAAQAKAAVAAAKA